MNKKKKYTHLSYEERVKLDILIKQGLSIRKAAKALNRSPNTISREIKENKVKEVYTPKKAQHKSYFRRYRSKINCMKVAMSRDITRFVFKKLVVGWSPERISGYLKTKGVLISKKAIYKFVYSRCLERYLFKRKVKRKSGKKYKKFEKLSDGRKYIEERSLSPHSGHYEADFVVSSKSRTCLLVIVDMHSRYTMIRRLRDRKYKTVINAFCEMFNDSEIKSLTLDNDISFACWKVLERRLNTKIYFTHPYCSWEKGLVENTNRWIRCFVPKKKDIALVHSLDIREALKWLNYIPRQCLNYKTAYEVFNS